MAQTKIPDDMLQPGDIIDVTYAIVGDNQTLVDLAIHEVKKQLAADPRFDYQGSRIEQGFDADQVPQNDLIISVQVRKYLRGQRPETQEASIGLIGIASLLAGLIALGAYYTHAIKYVSANKRAIAENPLLSDSVKVAALQEEKTFGQGVAAAGGSLMTAMIIIGVLWAMSLSRRRSGDD